MSASRRVRSAVLAIPVVNTTALRLLTWLRKRSAAHAYSEWVRTVDTPSAGEIARRRREAETFGIRPTVSILMPLSGPDPARLDASIRSVRGQSHPGWELCIAGEAPSTPAAADMLRGHARADARIKLRLGETHGSFAAASNAALELATGTHVALLGPHDLLPPLALHWVVEAINRHPDAQIVYSDEDKADGGGRRFDPHFKGDFNHVLLLAQDAIARIGVYRRELVATVGAFREGFEGAEDHDLALRCVAAVPPDKIVHVPRILYHRRATGGPRSRGAGRELAAAEAARRAVAEHLDRAGKADSVEAAPESPGHLRIRHALPSPAPLASIVICTRDQGALLRTAVESIRSRTTYTNYEIVVLDNGSRDAATLACLTAIAEQPGITVVRDDSAFNYSRLNNAAVEHSCGHVVCLLNDDVEVLTPEWLEEMVAFAVQPGIGAVGARLWYPDGTLQHGGVIIGIGGVAGHAHPRLARGKAGYFGRGVLQQEVSAVTGACLAVRRKVFDEVGGLDERLAVAFNDVDLCLRLRAAGYRNVWTPFAELIHHESASRGLEDTPAKVARFRAEAHFMHERWGSTLRGDPHYNPNLSMHAGDFSLARPRQSWPARRNA